MRVLDRCRPAALVAVFLLLAACSGDPKRSAPAPLPSETGSSSIRPVPNRTPARWSTLADAPAPRQEVAAGLVGNEVYVAGGFDAAGGASPRVDIYDIRAGRWRVGPALPEGRHHPAAAVFRGQMYVVGGFGPNGASAEVFRLDADPPRWVRVAELNHARGAAAAVVAGARLFVFGGQGPGGALVAQTEVFEPDATSRWTDLAPLPTPSHHLAAAVAGPFVYVAAGRAVRESKTVNIAAFARYDTTRNSWEELPDVPHTRSGHGAAIVNDVVVLIGGEDPATGGAPSIAPVDAYSIETRTWSSLPAMPRPRHGIAVVGSEGKIYVFLGAGRTGVDPSNHVDALVL